MHFCFAPRVAYLAIGLLVACSANESGPSDDLDSGATVPPDSGYANWPHVRDASSTEDVVDSASADADDARMPADSPVIDKPFEGTGDPWHDPVPRASCRPSDSVDADLAGVNGDLQCNVDVIGRVVAPASAGTAWFKDCFYQNGSDGTSVIYVDQDGQPSVTTVLTEIGFRGNWETMKLSEQTGLLVGYEGFGSTLAVSDVSVDCKRPIHQASIQLGGILGSQGHAGNFSPDGTIYYATSLTTNQVFAVDLAMPSAPSVITDVFERGSHDLFISKNGTRGYFAYSQLITVGSGSLSIMDLSDIQARKPGAAGRMIKDVIWEDGNITQYPMALTYRGQDYLFVSDELGSGNCDNPKKPQWGYGRIFDISDELNPKLVSLFKTEAQDPKNCAAASEAAGGSGGFGFGTHYCNTDRYDEPRVLLCSNFDAGLRIYDIRNPWRPKEIGYFDTMTANMPGRARIVPEKREIWVAALPQTFFVLRYPKDGVIDQVFD